MKLKFILIPFILCLIIAFTLFAAPQSALAALGVSGVTPNNVSNGNAVILTISGSDFADGAVASLNGYGSLSTTFVNANTLTAVLPAGVPVGSYTLTVTNPDTTAASLPNALTVQAPVPTATATTAISGYERPLLVVQSSGANVDAITPGNDFTLDVRLFNAGQLTANNVVVTFAASTSLVPLSTGGVIALGQVHPNNRSDLSQAFTASSDLWGSAVVTVDMTVSYTDEGGAGYSEKFTLTLSVKQPNYRVPTGTPSPTPTPTATTAPVLRPQLVITNYSTTLDPLQPGTQFILSLEIQNLGNADAKRVTMIVGGGSSTSGSGGEGTPTSGGISGGGGEFTNFAPLGSSNVQSLGDLDTGASTNASQALIVNVSTNPGAYPFKISFVYTNERGVTFTDDQVITLLVYAIPQVEISFYTDPGPLFAGQPGMLPLQIINLGRKTAILGNMRVDAVGATLANNTILIGALDTGGYFTLDATIIPDMPGTLELLVTVNYTDDFNQSQQISRSLTVEVLEGGEIGPIGPEDGGGGFDNGGGEPIPAEPETFWQKVWRFILGLIGLDSAPSQPEVGIPVEGEIPIEGEPIKVSPPMKMP